MYEYIYHRPLDSLEGEWPLDSLEGECPHPLEFENNHIIYGLLGTKYTEGPAEVF